MRFPDIHRDHRDVRVSLQPHCGSRQARVWSLHFGDQAAITSMDFRTDLHLSGIKHDTLYKLMSNYIIHIFMLERLKKQ